jgi:hypothetical protein
MRNKSRLTLGRVAIRFTNTQLDVEYLCHSITSPQPSRVIGENNLHNANPAHCSLSRVAEAP